MTEMQTYTSEFNQLDIEVEEFKLLRQEIMYYNEAAFRTEIYVVASCGIVWAWIVANTDSFNTKWDVATACSIPLFVLIAGFIRYLALKFRVARLAFYIYCIEQKFFKGNEFTGGWEHFVGRTRGNNLIGRADDANGTFYWERQAEQFKTVKFKWSFFTRSANLTWFSVLVLNVAAMLYVLSL